jgi:protein phosphatase 2C family protein 2/3
MVLACDGIWDCMNNQQVVDFVRYKLCHQKTLEEICEELMDYCLADKGNMAGIGCDNMTVIIVAFLRKRRTVKQWYEWMASKECPELPPRKPILISADIAPNDDTESTVKNSDKKTADDEKGAITAEPLPIEQK